MFGLLAPTLNINLQIYTNPVGRPVRGWGVRTPGPPPATGLTLRFMQRPVMSKVSVCFGLWYGASPHINPNPRLLLEKLLLENIPNPK